MEPKVETGIERHWREEAEAEQAERTRYLREALRPMSPAQMQDFHGYSLYANTHHLLVNPFGGIPFGGSLFGGMFGF